jgi:hypothetical protein
MRNPLTGPAALLLATLAVPAFGGPAFAQGTPAQSTPTQSAPTPSTRPTAGTHAHRWSPEQRAQRVEAHITKLHDELGITAAQEPQWKTFAQVMRDNATRMTKGFETRGARLGTMSAAANMQSYADMAVQHAQDIQRLAVAFQSVYDSLSPSQKQAADTLFRARRHGGHHGQHKMAPAKP